ncbi:MAG: hypothetical protein R3C45_12860 [Phycisphaerales bacterium]
MPGPITPGRVYPSRDHHRRAGPGDRGGVGGADDGQHRAEQTKRRGLHARRRPGLSQVESIAHGDDTRLLVFDNPSDSYFIAATSDPATPITNPITKRPYLVDYGSGTAEASSASPSTATASTATTSSVSTSTALDQPTDATITLGCEGLTVTITADANTGETVIGGLTDRRSAKCNV